MCLREINGRGQKLREGFYATAAGHLLRPFRAWGLMFWGSFPGAVPRAIILWAFSPGGGASQGKMKNAKLTTDEKVIRFERR